MAAVIYTPELLETFLLLLNITTLLHCQRVSKYFQTSIENSIWLRRALYLEPYSTTKPPLSHDPESLINPLLDCARLRFDKHSLGFVAYTEEHNQYHFSFVFEGKVDVSGLKLWAGVDHSSWQSMLLTHSKRPLRIRCEFREGENACLQGVNITLPSSCPMGEICAILFAQRRKHLWDAPLVGRQWMKIRKNWVTVPIGTAASAS